MAKRIDHAHGHPVPRPAESGAAKAPVHAAHAAPKDIFEAAPKEREVKDHAGVKARTAALSSQLFESLHANQATVGSVRKLLEGGGVLAAVVLAPDEEGNTPLHHAAMFGAPADVMDLLRFTMKITGHNPDAPNRGGHTADEIVKMHADMRGRQVSAMPADVYALIGDLHGRETSGDEIALLKAREVDEQVASHLQGHVLSEDKKKEAAALAKGLSKEAGARLKAQAHEDIILAQIRSHGDELDALVEHRHEIRGLLLDKAWNLYIPVLYPRLLGMILRHEKDIPRGVFSRIPFYEGQDTARDAWLGDIGKKEPQFVEHPLFRMLGAIKRQIQYTAPFRAAKNGDIESIRMFLDAGADVNQRDSTNRTLLMVAAERGDAAMVRFLLSRRADLTLVDGTRISRFLGYSQTARDIAAKMGHAAVLKELDATSGAVKAAEPAPAPKASAASNTKHTVAAAAAASEAPKAVAHDDEAEDKERAAAIKARNDAHAARYAAGRAGVNQVFASQMIEALDNKGGIQKFFEGRAEGGRAAAVNTISPVNDVTPFIRAIDKGGIDDVRYLLGHKADVNQRDANGITPLMHAVQRGDPELVRLLLEHKADASVRMGDGSTASAVANLLDAGSAKEAIIGMLDSYAKRG